MNNSKTEVIYNGELLVERLKTVSGLNQAKLAEWFNYNRSRLSNWKSSPPNIEDMLKFAKSFNCSLDYLYGLSDDKNGSKSPSQVLEGTLADFIESLLIRDALCPQESEIIYYDEDDPKSESGRKRTGGFVLFSYGFSDTASFIDIFSDYKKLCSVISTGVYNSDDIILFISRLIEKYKDQIDEYEADWKKARARVSRAGALATDGMDGIRKIRSKD